MESSPRGSFQKPHLMGHCQAVATSRPQTSRAWNLRERRELAVGTSAGGR